MPLTRSAQIYSPRASSPDNAIHPESHPIQPDIAAAYARLTRDQLVLFLSIRSLPTHGTPKDLAERLAAFDIHSYSPLPHRSSPPRDETPLQPLVSPKPAPTLPAELLAEIHDHVGDWELAMAVGVRTSLKQPREWEQATRMDEAVLSGSLVRVRSADPTSLTQAGARVAIRFGYLDILEYLRDNARPAFERHYGVDGARIPNLASQLGRTSVLEWWLASGDFPKIYRADAMDDASTNGHVQVLEWWLQSRLPLKYTEASLEHASAKGHIAVLAWWKQSGLPLKIGRVMESAAKAPTFDALDWWARSQLDFKYDNAAVLHASCAGKVEVLRWWHESGLQMMYDREVLTGATRHNRPEVLEWWGKSGLPIQYRICDIEEALEDAVRPGSESKEWWARRGVNFNATNVEWMKWKNLN